MMNHGSLFSGIGGFDLASEWMGWKNIFHCEIEQFPRDILKYYWPKSISYEDIKQTDFRKHRGTIDIVSGGFPCQPFSTSGRRRGKNDDRHLWPEMLRAIREIHPRYIVGENVYGLVNWNGGLVFNEVQTDLENEGYEVLPVILPACSIGAPHRRDRVWFVAYANKRSARSPRKGKCVIKKKGKNNDEPKKWRKQAKQHIRCRNVSWDVTNRANTRAKSLQRARENSIYEFKFATNTRLFRPKKRQKQTMGFNQLRKKQNAPNTRCLQRQNRLYGKKQERKTTKFGNSYTKFGNWSQFPTTEPTICRRNDGISSKLDGITFPKWRNESIKAYGNAIVPQIAYIIFKIIDNLENAKT